MLAFHVAISLVAIALGVAMTVANFRREPAPGLHAAFLITTIGTSLSGLPLPADRLLPSHIVAAISLALLSLAVYARYAQALTGRWAAAYHATALGAFYFNLLVLVVQAFLHVPPLHQLAPKGEEPPFVAAQVLLLVVFAPLAWKSARAAMAR